MSTARALYDCEGLENSDELSFKKGDVINQVSNSEEDGWLVGVLQTSGQQGLFPANYVEVISDKEESHKPRNPAVAAKPPGIVGSKNNYTVRSSPSIISSSQSKSKVPEIASVSRTQEANDPDTTQISQEIDSPAMSVKALRAKLESSGTASTVPTKQPISLESPKPRAPPVASSPAKIDEEANEEPVESMKPSELRKKWAAVDAASKQNQPVGAALRTNTKRVSTVAEAPRRAENTMPMDTKPILDGKHLQSSSFVPTPVRSSPGNIPIIQPRPTAGLPPTPPRRPSTFSNTYSRSSVSSVTEEEDSNNASRPVSHSDRKFQVPPRTLPRRPEVQSQIYPSNKPSGPPLPSRPQSVSATPSQKSGPTPPPRPTASPRPTPSKRPSSVNLPRRPTSHMLPPATASIQKNIAVIDRTKYEKMFNQHSEQGYVYYEAAFDLWRASRIGDENIGQICHLVDIREDGWLDKKQFCAGMFLIDERLRGVCVPKSLPQAYFADTSNFSPQFQFVSPSPTSRYRHDNTIYVNPLIGTSGAGHVFPGATIPFGIAKPGPDMAGSDNQAGYNPDGMIKGFSQLHSDGWTYTVTHLELFGSILQNPSYGNIIVQPLTGTEWALYDYRSKRIENSESKSLHGYLANIVKYDFHDSDNATILINVGDDLMGSFMGGSISLDQDSNQNLRVVGNGMYRPSFAPYSTFKVYFCSAFNLAASNVSLFDGKVYNNTQTTLTGSYGGLGALVYFDKVTKERPLVTRIGISFVSTSQACESAENEVPTFDFDEVKELARELWKETLGKIQVESASLDDKLYRHFISPVNKTGENPKWNSSEPYYDDFYCLWDTYHGVMPLYALTHAKPLSEMVRGLIDIYRNEGYMPDCYMGLGPGFTQGGSNAEMPLVDFLLKHGKEYGDISWDDGFDAMIKDATVEPTYQGAIIHGRGDVDFYNENGYVPAPDGSTWDRPQQSARSASRTVEYARNDFAIALAAHALGNSSAYNTYIKKANNWINLWNPDIKEDGFSGFIMPKYKNGTWNNYPPQFCGPTLNHFSCFLDGRGGEFYEESSWIYSFSAPQDQFKLIELMGGPEIYTKRLDHYFEKGYHDMGDEPAFLVPYLYNWVGRMDKTTDIVRHLLRTNFWTNATGLPGNDDSGAEGSFVVWSMMGFYPVAGTDVYLLSSPLFSKMTLNMSVNSTFTIIANNLTETNRYVKSAKLNGVGFERNWIRHSEICNLKEDTTLELDMAAEWFGYGQNSLPPAISGDVPWVV
ncbi:hypothetical protein INT43_003780 [Umbelopsis isabellina]|uniref:SH3 domain-containing protein n=1 Tax=Mortierella isabellina TaxID=91625 RepID=A0A8H7UHF7_MORIS|nr:hypothetical protein INT43_003780 [Umbelopsis isabellina]